MGLKISKFLVADPDLGSGTSLTLNLGSVMEKFRFRIRDKHPGSSILEKSGQMSNFEYLKKNVLVLGLKGFSCSLDNLYEVLGTSKFQLL